ncbi:MAG TPA: hypothetical protein VMG99_04130 [Thermoplasmata archaeon]|jgi:hypothetical protein|nr:hypothetical protein [Thermoplasmata archaeon]
MLRADRTRADTSGLHHGNQPQMTARELLLAVAPPPRTHSYYLSGWPNWLVPTYRSGAHRAPARTSEDER